MEAAARLAHPNPNPNLTLTLSLTPNPNPNPNPNPGLEPGSMEFLGVTNELSALVGSLEVAGMTLTLTLPQATYPSPRVSLTLA